MFYTVAEVAELTNLSKVSIYNKLKLKELKPYVTKKQGVTYIDDQGLKLIKNSLSSFNMKLNIDTEKPSEMAETQDFKEGLNVKDDYLNYLKMENERLWNELQEKNNQIDKLSQLVENGQVLLREKPIQDMQLLEEHCDQIDEKIIQVKERMQEKQVEQQSAHKSLWNRFWNKSKDY